MARSNFITFEDSLAKINALTIAPVAPENVYIGDIAGRILYEDIPADHDNPAKQTAAMDGYALRSVDQDQTLALHGDNPAGSVGAAAVSAGTCVKTFTGSLMPAGSDTLVPVENAAQSGDTVRIEKTVPKGFAVRKRGETYARGEILLKKGTTLGFGETAVLASLNKAFVKVYQQPKVAIASSGSEILDLAQPRTNAAQIRSANHLALQALVQRCGAQSVQLGVVADDKDTMLQTVRQGLQSSDIVVTTGGVSVGDYDFTREVIEKCGASVIFHGVKLKPGQHLLLAQKDNKLILALPGFAYSAAVTALLYLPALLARFWQRSYSLHTVQAVMDEAFEKPYGKYSFTAVRVFEKEGIKHADFKTKKFGSSADLTNLKTGDGLLMLDEDTTRITPGQKVSLLLL